MIEHYDSVDVFVGVDVGKGEHHAVAQDRAGKVLVDKALPNDEAKLREVVGKLKRHGQVLFVVDQPATIGALPGCKELNSPSSIGARSRWSEATQGSTANSCPGPVSSSDSVTPARTPLIMLDNRGSP
ncbi:hypothetical protein RCH23_002967 [Cryobacterium sp. CAN_C3]|nr:hypothetical protein [Cryobacterium sp. CAN_C3]